MTGHRMILLVALSVILLLAACRSRGEQQVVATPRPTLTPTPVSTPLPIVPTAIPAGFAENPLRMVLVPYLHEEAQEQETVLEELLVNETGIAVDIVLVENYAEALAALCDSTGDVISGSWLGGISFAAAKARNCGAPELEVRRTNGADARSGESGLIVISGQLGATSVSAFDGRVYCRLGYDDFYSWLLPSIVLRANQIVPADFENLIDYDNMDDLLAAVRRGDCTGTGLSEVEYNQRATDDETFTDEARVASTTPAFPYSILMLPLEVELGIRLPLTNGLIDLAANGETAVLLQPFLGQDELARVATEQFDELDAFLADTDLDLAQLGN